LTFFQISCVLSVFYLETDIHYSQHRLAKRLCFLQGLLCQKSHDYN
jgi:hypothetical protein